MVVLVDTGLLLRAFDRDAPERTAILQAIRTIRSRGDDFVVTVQNLAEFWNVSTRPRDRNGFALSPETVARRLQVIDRIARVVTESQRSYSEWVRIVTELNVLGVKVHDARLVSVMLAEGISSILTLNERDFERYKAVGIAVETPADAGRGAV